jgi:hypothetical protein
MTGRAARYWREIAAVLLLKVAALYAIHAIWFDQPLPRPERSQHLQTHVYGAVPVRGHAAGLNGND